MRYRTFGRSGLRVSEMFLGTMTFGTEWGWGASVEECGKLLAAYAEAGQFETAIETASVASQLAESQAQHDLAAQINQETMLYRQHSLIRKTHEFGLFLTISWTAFCLILHL